MIGWVMPPQTAVALYIYRAGRSCPARNPFTARNSQELLNSTRTRGPPVRPTGLTGGVSLIGLVLNLGANNRLYTYRDKVCYDKKEQALLLLICTTNLV
jgi:hypothetical protein